MAGARHRPTPESRSEQCGFAQVASAHSAQNDVSGSRLLEKCRYTAILSLWVCRSQGGPPGGEWRRSREPEAVDGPGQHQGHHRERENCQERTRIQKAGIRGKAREAITLRTLRSNPMRE